MINSAKSGTTDAACVNSPGFHGACHRARIRATRWFNPGYRRASPQIQLLEEIIALVVDDDEGRKIHHLDAPDRFHAQLRILHDLDLLDAVFGEVGRRPTDRAEIEAAMLLAGLTH